MKIMRSGRKITTPGSRRGLRRRALLGALTGLALVGLVLTGGTQARAATTTVTEKNNPTFGTILADSSGRTLYTLTNSGQPVLCTAVCAQVWPPLTVPPGTSPTGPSGVCCLGTMTNANGDAVTYKGDPLYRYVNDSSPSDATGDGVMSFGGTWHVVRVAASTTTTTAPAVTTTAPAAPSTTAVAAPTTLVAPPSTAANAAQGATVGSAGALPTGSPGTGGTPPRGSDTPLWVGLAAIAGGVAWAASSRRRNRGGP